MKDIRRNSDGMILNMSEEYNTVGINHIVEFSKYGTYIRRFHVPMIGETLTENTIRAEHGLAMRIQY